MKKIFEYIKKKFCSPFPKTIKDYWYTGMWHLHKSDLRREGKPYKSDEVQWPIEDKIIFDPFKTGLCRADESGLVDGLIPAIKKDGYIGLYTVISERRMQGGDDLAVWDDGMEIDLRFVKAVKDTDNE